MFVVFFFQLEQSQVNRKWENKKMYSESGKIVSCEDPDCNGVFIQMKFYNSSGPNKLRVKGCIY